MSGKSISLARPREKSLCSGRRGRIRTCYLWFIDQRSSNWATRLICNPPAKGGQRSVWQGAKLSRCFKLCAWTIWFLGFSWECPYSRHLNGISRGWLIQESVRKPVFSVQVYDSGRAATYGTLARSASHFVSRSPILYGASAASGEGWLLWIVGILTRSGAAVVKSYQLSWFCQFVGLNVRMYIWFLS